MNIFLLLSTLSLLVILLYMVKSNKKLRKDLEYLGVKLNSIIINETDESVKVFTDEDVLKRLLEEINSLLNYNRNTRADSNRNEASMKKMLSNVSHDLKTPLTVVIGYIETMMLDDDMDISKRKILLEKVHSKGNELVELINKFFDLAKLESDDMDVPLTIININEICKMIMLGFYDTLKSKKIKVLIDIPDEIIKVHGNEDALNRVFNNLISNAIKYGSDGNTLGININSDDIYAYIEIWDCGKGIDSKYHEEVFERLYTLEDSRNRLYQGSGLGLTISKRLVEQMNGEISIISDPFKKTSFIVKLRRINY